MNALAVPGNSMADSATHKGVRFHSSVKPQEIRVALQNRDLGQCARKSPLGTSHAFTNVCFNPYQRAV